ncbi:hypothetical protein VitviT2T_028207 [Vitis vinifera]|uniref:Thymidylate synthase/dCMP hydroxymethylase domain-containing protein n=1 Tax=Vitis vinifera TaxID=29760 RepID=A0ABY9DSF0_VITVI|nr:hypothetical protein VitviT2T_028207 [Vitis vinifera]
MARRTALAKRLELYRSALVEIEEGVLLESLVQSFKRVQELLWFISGTTNAKVLQEKGIHIWDGNAPRDYLDSIVLEDKDEGPVSDFNGSEAGNEF